MGPFGIGHVAPDLVSAGVSPFVVGLGGDDEDDVVSHQR